MRALTALLLAAAAAPAMAQGAPQPAAEAYLMAPVLRVSDCARVQGFYEAAFGMKVLMSRDLGPIHETMLAFGGTHASSPIMLICRSAAGKPEPRGIGASRLIINSADLDALTARLDAAHLAHPAIRQVEGGSVRVLNLADPDGNELEVVQTAAARPRSHP